ncbi:transcriptional regulator [Candidatus Saccharibacteria bacterium]|nr:transcriptional regulator [Candidatus Saccharibacteria bacterium]
MQFNELFREYRMAHGTVRQFAKEHGYDVAYISRLENGITMPPKDNDKLAKLAVALGIEKGTDKWQEFFDLAAVAKNELPADLQDNERVAKILPAFYRTLRNEQLGEEDVEKLLELIKNSGKGEAE